MLEKAHHHIRQAKARFKAACEKASFENLLAIAGCSAALMVGSFIVGDLVKTTAPEPVLAFLFFAPFVIFLPAFLFSGWLAWECACNDAVRDALKRAGLS